jgi:hypothetical protein
MAPKGLEKAEQCLVAIMHGLEVGLTPMASLQRIAVVNGRPTIWGDGAIGLVRGSGACEWIREKIEGEGDRRVAICEAKRKGEPEPIRSTFSCAAAGAARAAKARPASRPYLRNRIVILVLLPQPGSFLRCRS